MATKRVRWECPNGCRAVLGPSKPRRENIVRYCLACSAKAGILVERSAPSLERVRQQKAEGRAARQKAKAARAEAQQRKRHDVEGHDLRELWKMALKLPSLKAAAHAESVLGSLYRVGATRDTEYRRTQVSGRTDGRNVHLSVGVAASASDATGVLIHELAHNACRYDGEPWMDKDSTFGRRCHDAIDEWNERYGDVVYVDPLGRGKAYRGVHGRRNRRRLQLRQSEGTS